MASTTIHTLAYKIVADASKFKSEMHKTNAEMAAAKRVTDAYMPALDKHQMEITALGQLYAKGRITVDTYNRALKAQKIALSDLTTSGKLAGKAADFLSSRWGALFSVAALAGTGRRIVKEIDDLDKLAAAADRTGLSFETLQRISTVGKFEGLSSGDIVDATQKMMRLVALAENGNAKANKALSQAGLDVKTLTGKSVEDRFRLIADAISGITDEGQRLLALQNLFGDAGENLLPLLEEGADGFDELIDRAETYAGVVSGTQSEKIKEAADSLDNLSISWGSFWRQVSVEAIPIINDLNDTLVSARNLMEFGLEGLSPLPMESRARSPSPMAVVGSSVNNFDESDIAFDARERASMSGSVMPLAGDPLGITRIVASGIIASAKAAELTEERKLEKIKKAIEEGIEAGNRIRAWQEVLSLRKQLEAVQARLDAIALEQARDAGRKLP